MPVPARADLLSGRHFNSLRTENRLDRAGDTSPSFILLHEMTVSLCKSIQDRTTDSKPSVVTSEHPSSERNFTLLQMLTSANMLLSNPQQCSNTTSLTASHTINSACKLLLSRSWHRCICSVSTAGHVPRCSDGPGSASILLQLCILRVFRFPQKDNAASQPSSIRWSEIVNSSSIMQHRPMAEIPS